MKNLIWIVAVLFSVQAHAQSGAQPTQPFGTYIQTLPLASTPLTGNEQMYVLQGGVSKKVLTSNVIGAGGGGSPLTVGTTVINNGTTGQLLYNNGGVLGNSFALSSVASLTAQDQTLAGGANVTGTNLGTVSSGTTTVDCGKSPLQYLTNGGAFTLAGPASDGSCIIQTTNNGSAGTITFSGFSQGSNSGDSLDTTNGHKFSISVYRINSISHYLISAYQ